MSNSQNIISRFFFRKREKYKNKIAKKNLKNDILNYYSPDNSYERDDKLREALTFLKKKGLHYFPHPFAEKYKPNDVEVFTDKDSGLNYVFHNGHKLYFRRETSVRRIKRVYAFLLCEQDQESPHCYQTDSFSVEDGDVLFDIGAAEGNFSLSVIDKVSKVYIFEAEESWLEPLKKTFEPWKDKVEIINKYVSDKDSVNTVKIDTITKEFSSDNSIFLKLDVEGAEEKVLEGAQSVLSNFKTKAAICTYHNQDDYEILTNLMQKKGFNTEPSDGYMLYLDDEKGIFPPYFRRGLIRCQR